MVQMANYVFPDYYANTAAQSASTFAMLIGMIISAALAKPLVGLFGKSEISAISSVIAAAVCIALFFIRPENVWVYVFFNLFAWLGLGVFTMVSWAIITDVIDYSEIKNGVREDGSIYALYSFARKLGQAAAAGLTGLLLSLIGYEKVDGVPLSSSVKAGMLHVENIYFVSKKSSGVFFTFSFEYTASSTPSEDIISFEKTLLTFFSSFPIIVPIISSPLL